MNGSTKHNIWTAAKHYGYACFSKGWNGAIVAVWAFVGQATGAGLDPANFNIPTWRTLAYTFAVVFTVQVLGFLKDHPLPDKLPESTPPFASTTEIKEGKIITTADEPEKLEAPPKP